MTPVVTACPCSPSLDLPLPAAPALADCPALLSLRLQPPYEARAWKGAPCEDFSPLSSAAASQAKQHARQQRREAGGGSERDASAAAQSAAAEHVGPEGSSLGWAERQARVLAWLGRRV